jgi:AAA family ATP:ADP antiporter
VSEFRNRRIGAATALFLLTAAFTLVRTGRDAAYVSGKGVLALPLTYVAVAALSLPQAMLLIRLIDRWGIRRTRVAVLGVLAVTMASYAHLLTPGSSALMSAFFVAVPLLFAVAFSTTWLIGTEFFERAPESARAHAFSWLGGASILGGVAGSLAARSSATRLAPSALVGLGAALVLCSTVVVGMAHRRHPATRLPEEQPVRVLPQRMFQGATLRLPRVWLLILAAGAASATGVLLEFQFYVSAAGGSVADTASYFATTYLVLNTLALSLQLLVSPRLQARLGVGASLLPLPLTIAGGAAMLLLMPSPGGRAALRVAEGGLKSGMHRTSWEQTFLALEHRDRPAAKALVEALGARMAEGLAGGLLLLWLKLLGDPKMLDLAWVIEVSAVWATVALLLLGLVWVALTIVLARSLGRDRVRETSSCEDAPFGDHCQATAALGRAHARAVALPFPAEDRARAPHAHAAGRGHGRRPPLR